jgi:pyruvate dehydrogenase E2 component (dihydrolipoamide acetyltransferase)
MATDITMPKLSDTMTEGKLGAWKKSVGDPVQRGDVIAEVETDKAVMDLEAFASGVLLEQRVKAGELVPVGTVIGSIGAPGEQPSATGPAAAPVPEAAPSAAQPGNGPELVKGGDEPLTEPPRPDAQIGDVPERVLNEGESPGVSITAPPVHPHEEQAAPVVRRRARELGIDLAMVEGSGPGGRILLQDLERFAGVSLASGEEPAAAAEPPAEAPPPTVSAAGAPAATGSQPLSRMRAAIARTVSQSWQTIPHFFVTMEIAMDAAMEVRRELKESGTAVSVNDLVIKGAAMAIGRYPLVHTTLAGDRLVTPGEINIGVAVSLPDGLLIPVIRGCERLSLKEIAGRSRLLAERARSGKLGETELTGGTFTISNLGMYGVTEFTAVIHPGQAAILAVGAVRETMTVRDGQPALGKTLRVTLSCDHRLLDGAYAARFLGELKLALENPVKLLL